LLLINNRLDDLKAKAKRKQTEDIDSMISLLTAASNELKAMADDNGKDLFSFKHITGDQGFTYRDSRDSNIIVMEVLNYISAIHELTHAWQYHTGQIQGVGKDNAKYFPETVVKQTNMRQ
jgi:hypothetical protein